MSCAFLYFMPSPSHGLIIKQEPEEEKANFAYNRSRHKKMMNTKKTARGPA